MNKDPSIFDTPKEGDLKPIDDKVGALPEAHQKYALVNEWVDDLTPYLENESKIKFPDNENLYKANLQKLPKHAWMAECSFELVHPEEGFGVDEQAATLTSFLESLHKDALTLDESVIQGIAQSGKIIALDLETTGLDTRILFKKDGTIDPQVKIVGICLSTAPTKGYYLPLKHTGEDGILNWDYQVAIDFLSELHKRFIVIYHNGMYDREVCYLNQVRLRPTPYWYDTLLMYHLIQPDQKRKGLKILSEQLLGRAMLHIQELFPTADAKKNILFSSITAKSANAYACSDATNTMALFLKFLTEESTKWIFESCVNTVTPIDHRVSDATRAFTRQGLPLNVQKSILNLKDLIRRSTLIEQKVYKQSGYVFKLGSQKDLNKVLFQDLGLNPLEGQEVGKSGLFPVGADILENMAKENPEVLLLNLIVIYRKINSQQNFHAKVIANTTLDYHRDHFWAQLQFSLSTVPTGRYSSSSSKGSSGVKVKFNKKSIAKKFVEGSKTIGMNSQGIPVVYAYDMPFKKISPDCELFESFTRGTKDLYNGVEEEFFRVLTKPVNAK